MIVGTRNHRDARNDLVRKHPGRALLQENHDEVRDPYPSIHAIIFFEKVWFIFSLEHYSRTAPANPTWRSFPVLTTIDDSIDQRHRQTWESDFALPNFY